jgi:hypothetical protein
MPAPQNKKRAALRLGLSVVSILVLMCVIVIIVIAVLVTMCSPLHNHYFARETLPREDRIDRIFESLETTATFLDSIGVDYWVSEGTLLGAYRDNQIIAWDEDSDVAINSEDRDKVWGNRDKVPKPFELVRLSTMFALDKVIPGVEDWFPRETILRIVHKPSGLFCDIAHYSWQRNAPSEGVIAGVPSDDGGFLLEGAITFVSRRCSERPCSGTNLKTFTFPTVYPLGTIRIRDRDFRAPAKVEEYLKYTYGDDLSPDHTENDGEFECHDKTVSGKLMHTLARVNNKV